MKQIKTYESYIGNDSDSSLNEGALLIGGILLGAMMLPALVDAAKSAWTKKMMEMKYKPTGQVEKIEISNKGGKIGQPKELSFKIYKDDKGQKFWALEVIDRATGDAGYETAQIFLYDENGLEKLKREGILGVESNDVDDPHGIYSGYGLRAAQKWKTKWN
jgi:hypothetical protein